MIIIRALFITRGAPGAGKSTWIKENHLEAYTICPDDLRVLHSSKKWQPDGSFCIEQEPATENAVWATLFNILEYRMKRGEMTVIDATASKTKDLKQYKDIAAIYRYHIYVVDFTTVPLETCLAQNKMRDQYKIVPEAAVKNIYARFVSQPVPSGLTVIKPEEFKDIIKAEPVDLTSYRKLVFVGDIHGCYDTLMQYPDFKDGLNDDTGYIFTGDYLDRGHQNVEVFNFLMSIKDKPNVCLLEGNHEKHLKDYGNELKSKSMEFEERTKPELIAGNITPKQARVFCSKLRQMSYIKWGSLEIVACHGGIPSLPETLMTIPTYAFINGVGQYKDYLTVADTWMTTTKDTQYLIHGHRNTNEDPIHYADRVFNLEGGVEFGGKLRIVELEHLGFMPEYGYTTGEGPFPKGSRICVGLNSMHKWTPVELESIQPITQKEKELGLVKVETVEDAVKYLRENQFVSEKQLANGISSFNFTREAFYSANWNRQTVLARGLFIDTENNKIMARSYEKFFRINETKATNIVNLRSKLKFPVQAYVKENGFLAIVSYDYKNDDLFIASKSTNNGPYVEYIKAQLEPYREKLLKHFRTAATPQSYVFECIDIENDPHIIKYEQNKLVLLDIIFNDLRFATVPYHLLVEEANWLGCPVKELAYTLKDFDEFNELYNALQDEEYKYNGNYIEGFVFVDADGFMTKCKSEYYNTWKHLRGVVDSTLRCGGYSRVGSLLTPEKNLFYGFCRECYKNDRNPETKEYPYKTDIISMREKFLARKEIK